MIPQILLFVSLMQIKRFPGAKSIFSTINLRLSFEEKNLLPSYEKAL